MGSRHTLHVSAIALVFGLSFSAFGEAPYQIEWARQFGTGEWDDGRSVAVDGMGNVYVSGWTNGDLGGTNAGSSDAFLTKYDHLGNLLWMRQVGTDEIDYSTSVALDASGNAYITGYTFGSLAEANAGAADAFLIKYDSLGNQLWSQQIGAISGDVSHAVAVDSLGNVYISGYTYTDLAGTSAGGQDAYLIKFDSLGNHLWSEQIGTSSGDQSWSVAVDGTGNAYISGRTAGSLGRPNVGSQDAFLVKYDSSGNLLWSQQIGTSEWDQSMGVTTDNTGNLYIGGSTRGNLGGPDNGDMDVFLTKIDSSGNELWSRQIGTSDLDRGWSVAVDGAGNIFISGDTEGDLGGPNTGNKDAFLAKFDSSGSLLWTQQIGSTQLDQSWTVTVDGSGNAYITGQTRGNLGGPNAGDYDAFLVKYSPIPEPATLLFLGAGGLLAMRRKAKV